ncbi:hypothetical protein Hena1_00230 [Erwinia phage Hena1]|uniref:Uncharacterized protein n=1 Tax=Erwinia phage Hena1 TaxID=2678601 RepID=A0A6B9J9N7_9CAUD|nr:hypothetical protein HWC84_gp022 [Erwinia phage Hena1]QGZ16199.1 hypothetical protein Hena1_00230 [Erwinia phage Hena1]
MSFGSDMTLEQMEALRERYIPLVGRAKEGTRCLHKACTECKGTGIRRNGGICIHGIACPCPNCSFTC